MEILQALESLNKLEKQEFIQALNRNALAAGAANGSKDAGKQIQRLTNELIEEQREHMEVHVSAPLTEEIKFDAKQLIRGHSSPEG